MLSLSNLSLRSRSLELIKTNNGNQVAAKRLRNYDFISNLPEEILVFIFSFLTHEVLYKVVRLVCKRWFYLTATPTLWTKITVKNEVPTAVLRKWVQSSYLLKDVELFERTDIDAITEDLSKYAKNLESIKIENCWGNSKSNLLKSRNLCNLVTRCKNLNNFHFSGIKILSCKFFKLLSKRKRTGKITKKCSYYGPVSQKQMQALVEAIVSSEVYEGATLLTASKRMICIDNLFDGNHLDIPITVENMWDDIVNNNLEPNNEMDVDG